MTELESTLLTTLHKTLLPLHLMQKHNSESTISMVDRNNVLHESTYDLDKVRKEILEDKEQRLGSTLAEALAEPPHWVRLVEDD